MKVYLQIDEVQDAKYEIAKHINKITTKHTQIPTKEEHQKLKPLQNVKRKLKNNNIIHVKADKGKERIHQQNTRIHQRKQLHGNKGKSHE